MFGRKNSFDVVFQNFLETWPRLYFRIPQLGVFVAVPRNVAQIVDNRQVCGYGNVGQRKIVAGQIVAPFGQPVDVFEMKVEVVNADFQNFRVRRIAKAETLKTFS